MTDPAKPDTVKAVIDGIEVEVPKGTLIIRAAEEMGVQIPRFCDHPLLDPVGACRQCLVEVSMPDREGNVRPMPKPQPACAMELSPGMEVKTQATSQTAEVAQHAMMEFLLINHPLDCPVCDKGGECPLQNFAMSNGRGETRFVDVKRTFPKPIKISTQILLDRDRCILCQRCTRFSKEIAGDPFIELHDRGVQQQINTFSPGVLGIATQGDALQDESGQPFASYFSGNTIQICPVGALTSAGYRFRSRPFDLISSPGVCESCSVGCAIRVDHRRGVILRRQAGDDPQVNEEWICDKGRFAFHDGTTPDRLTQPMIREGGRLVPTSWPHALEVAGRGLVAARDGLFGGSDSDTPEAVGVGVLVSGQAPMEDAYAYAKFARVALRTNDIDARIRPVTSDEDVFLAGQVAGRIVDVSPTTPVTFADLERASTVLLVGLEPEEEVPIVFLRLRKAVRKNNTAVVSIAPFATRGLTKLSGQLLTATPGTEANVLAALAGAGGGQVLDAGERLNAAVRGLQEPGAIILVGERASLAPGALGAVVDLAAATGARIAWIPRRIGERGAVEAGALPTLLPGGRPVTDIAARVDVARTWGVEQLPAQPGLTATEILDAAAGGRLAGLLIAGVDLDDLPNPREALAALEQAFVVALEVRPSAAVDIADVVLPVAHVSERAGTFMNWEGRLRGFQAALDARTMTDLRVLSALAQEMGADFRLPDLAAARRELDTLGQWAGAPVAPSSWAPVTPPRIAPGQAVLATWHHLLDNGRTQVGEPYLAGTAHRAVVRMSQSAATRIGWAQGRNVSVSTDHGTITLPVVITPMPDGVVWIPTNSGVSTVRRTLRAVPGDVVQLAVAEPEMPAPAPEKALLSGATADGGNAR